MIDNFRKPNSVILSLITMICLMQALMILDTGWDDIAHFSMYKGAFDKWAEACIVGNGLYYYSIGQAIINTIVMYAFACEVAKFNGYWSFITVYICSWLGSVIAINCFGKNFESYGACGCIGFGFISAYYTSLFKYRYGLRKLGLYTWKEWIYPMSFVGLAIIPFIVAGYQWTGVIGAMIGSMLVILISARLRLIFLKKKLEDTIVIMMKGVDHIEKKDT